MFADAIFSSHMVPLRQSSPISEEKHWNYNLNDFSLSGRGLGKLKMVMIMADTLVCETIRYVNC
jgi:hypothetical protein